MATPKSWTADDVGLGRLSLYREGLILYYDRRYWFVDDVGTTLDSVKGGRLTGERELSTVPQAILDALQTIDDWTYQEILEQEGMQDP